MAIYLYCLTEPGCEPLAELRGIAGERVRALGVTGRLGAWVSDLPEDPGPASTELVRVHDRVVRAALALETPLPARFGQSFESDAALERALQGRTDLLERSLDRVRGSVEMTVRILLAEAGDALPGRPFEGGVGMGASVESRAGSPAIEGAGRAYMARLRERQRVSAELQRQAEFLQARVARAVDGFARGEVCSPVMPGAQSIAISHLVAREAVREYRLAVASLSKGEAALRLMVSGPWAPYSFAQIAGE
ncbi:MAG TPA: GvpL/GvpF family gas vesicle protein [Gemmatimonadaceae bacterium]|nr:GvpL/GvpF family gas vesicle protein [Gemmatimonadaceae bacterium]